MHHSVDPGFFNSLPICEYLPTPNQQKKFFHYTDIESALNMLKLISEDKKPISFLDKYNDAHLEIWATHFTYLNDSEELRHGVRIFLEELKKSSIDEDIKRLIAQRLEELSLEFQVRKMPYYPLSFCDKGNLLSQWKYYGKECGVAIEYNLNKCCYKGYEFHDTPNQYFYLFDVLYGEEPQTSKQSVFKKLISEIDLFTDTDKNDTADRIIQAVCIMSLFMKQQAFWEEAESRLLFVIAKPSNRDNIIKPVIKFRKRGNMIIPYIVVQLHSINSNILPINSITIGPGQNQTLVFEAVYQYILTNFPENGICDDGNIHYSDDGCEFLHIRGIDLRRSTIPFRG